MDCKTFAQRLEACLAGDLTPAEQAEIEKHRMTCMRCQRSADRATRLDNLLRNGLTAAATMMPQEQIALRESSDAKSSLRDRDLV